MSIDVDTAIFQRWVAAGLHTAIAPLYPGEEAATPEKTEMPRANYFATSDGLEVESRDTLVRIKIYTFEVWGRTYETVAGYVRSIEDALLNSERSTTGFLCMASSRGHILSTHYIDEGTEKVMDDVFRGFYQMSVRWRKPKTTPA